ncbi:hypothetical protein [Rheinheimera tilapiae]|uniref:XRE family transcriptional regulator n=1 Tax=Rheinheimera tilapiae TaxID=875043 RepID=A0ABV6BCK4_9GAMM
MSHPEKSRTNVFSENLNALFERTGFSVKKLIKDRRYIDYTYFHKVRRGGNLTVTKAEAIVEMLKQQESFSWIELWMFFVPGYFERHNQKTAPDAEVATIRFVSDLLDDAGSVGILKSTPEQRDGVIRLAEILLRKADQ